MPRRLVYEALLAAPGRDWTVSQLVAVAAGAPLETVRTVVNMLLGERLMDLVPRRRVLTVRLIAEGGVTVREILDGWAAARHGRVHDERRCFTDGAPGG